MPPEGPFHLRRAVVEDASGIAAVHDGAWREELAVEAPDRKPWVALVDDRVVGVASGGIGRDDDADGRTGEVYALFVEPECWERGIRTNLLEHVLRDLTEHGFEQAVFWVRATDEPTRRFAEHMGFHVDHATRPEPVGHAEVEQLRFVRQLR